MKKQTYYLGVPEQSNRDIVAEVANGLVSQNQSLREQVESLQQGSIDQELELRCTPSFFRALDALLEPGILSYADPKIKLVLKAGLIQQEPENLLTF